MFIRYVVLIVLICCTLLHAARKPHIIYIQADDLGWNDVGFTGRSDLQTPNIDALAYHGRILTQHYALPSCTPSRTAFLTGKYPIRTGMQGYPLSPSEPRALPLYERLMPQYFKDLGYQTHLVGKWHLGYYEWKYTPTARKAFDTHFGYMNGFIGYYDHMLKVRNMTAGHDFWRGTEPQYNLKGRYVTEILTEESVRLIKAAVPEEAPPLFLCLAHLAPHASNAGFEYPEEDLQKFQYITDEKRQKYAAMVWNLDKSVGQIVETLAQNGMLNNSIIVFASDNGAPTFGLYPNYGSNFPLKGLKLSVYDGGVKTVAAVWNPVLHASAHGVSRQLFHVSDWLPTLYTAAGGDPRVLSSLDGRDQWSALLTGPVGSELNDTFAVRHELLINIDEVLGQHALRYKQWKLVKGTYKSPIYDLWWGEHPTADYNFEGVINSKVATTFKQQFPDVKTADQSFMTEQLSQTALKCSYPTPTSNPCAAEYCLFNMNVDPCEMNNVASEFPDIMSTLLAKMETYMQILKPQLNVPNEDVLADPVNYNDTWIPWHDGALPTVSESTKPCEGDNTTLCSSLVQWSLL